MGLSVRAPRARLRAPRAGIALAAVVLGANVLLATPAPARPEAPAVPRTVQSPPEGAVPDLAAYGWQQVLNEDFSGTSVDETVWDVWDRDMFGPQTRQALSVSGGNLTMSTYTDTDGVTKTGSLSTGAIGAETPTGDGFRAAYGYLETRIKVGDKAGTTDAFWLMTDNGNNSMPFGDVATDGPEIDVMEHGNGPNSNGDTNGDGICDWNASATALGVPCNELLTDGAHWDGFEEDHKVFHETFVKNPTATPLQNNFHTYSLMWTPSEYRMYVDGIETSRSSVGLSFASQHILLTTFAGPGNYGPLGNAANDHMVVDYVRVWQRPVADVPDQATAANTALAVPFTVEDFTYSSPAKPDPGTVTVTATSSNTTVVPNSGLAVAGDGIVDPDGAGPLEATDGSFQNGDFASGTGWSLTGGASIASGKLQITPAGGRAAQTITNLRPNTTYVVDGSYDLALEYGDTDGDDRVDPGETFTDVNDKKSRFDWGIQDVDTALAGDQKVRTSYERDGVAEQNRPTWWVREPWAQEEVKFTTGPSTTSVVLFVENTAYASPQTSDSAVSFDSVVVRPVIPAHRVVTVRPADGKVGQSTITLTAKNAAGSTLGTDTFVVTVGAGSLADGTFEAGPATTPWSMSAGAQLRVADPYRPDRQLLLAQSGNDTVVQTVTNLAPSSRYKLDVTGRVAQSGGELGIAVQGTGGTEPTAMVTSTSPSTQSVEFTTGASNTSANVLLLDWDVADGTSTAEKVTLSKCTTTTSCASLATDVGSVAPPALGTSPRSTVSGVPATVAFSLPSGATLTGVTSTNQVLVPNPNVVVETSATDALRKVVTASPLPDRTGFTKLRVAYTGAAGSPVDIPLTVSEVGLLQPGFEKAGAGWTASGTASFTTSGPRSGAYALQINGSGDAQQTIAVLPHGTDLEIAGWVNGTATVTLQTVPIIAGEQAETLATANWTGGGSGWTEGKAAFQTLLLPDTGPESWRPVKVTVTDTNPGDGQAVKVDDLSVVHRPAIRRVRDLSLHSGQTVPDWNTHRPVTYGRVADNAMWDPSAFTFTSSDIPGFGTGVVPAANLSPLHLFDNGWPFYTSLDAKAGGKTGRSLITVKLTDPATGNFTTRTYDITVNAGNSFNNGDFERSALGGPNTGWGGAWFNNSVDIRRKQGWAYLGIHTNISGWPYVGPRDDDKVLRISSGAVGTTSLITGLAPSTSYKLKFRAKGSGSTLFVKTEQNLVFGTNLGSVAISPPNTDNVWRDYEISFTTNASGNGSTSVAIYVVDDDNHDRDGDGDTDADDAIHPTPDQRPCALYRAGESCIDDIGLFKASDVT